MLNQLAKLKQQLQSESKRVETDLRSTQKEPEVYDPRLYQRPGEQSKSVTSAVRNMCRSSHSDSSFLVNTHDGNSLLYFRYQNVDVFDVASTSRQAPPSSRRRGDDHTDPSTMNEFKKLKKGTP